MSALFRFMLLLDFFGFPLGTRATYCVVGGGWVGRILVYLAKGVLSTLTYGVYCYVVKIKLSGIRTDYVLIKLDMT